MNGLLNIQTISNRKNPRETFYSGDSFIKISGSFYRVTGTGSHVHVKTFALTFLRGNRLDRFSILDFNAEHLKPWVPLLCTLL